MIYIYIFFLKHQNQISNFIFLFLYLSKKLNTFNKLSCVKFKFVFFCDIITCIFIFFFFYKWKKLKKVFNIAFVRNSYVVCIEKINHRRCSVSFISSRLQKWESFFIFSFTRFEMKTKETLKNSIIFFPWRETSCV